MSAVPEHRTDPSIEWAIDIVRETNDASISCLQRHMGVGYNRAARFIEEMEDKGIVSAMDASGKRTVLGESSSVAVLPIGEFKNEKLLTANEPITFRDRVFLAALPALVSADPLENKGVSSLVSDAFEFADEAVKQRGEQS